MREEREKIGGRRMRIDTLQREIKPLNQPVTVEVFLPDSYDRTDKKYPVLYMNDGQDVFRDRDLPGGGESLRFEQYYRDYGKFLPEVILVAIHAPKTASVRTALYAPFTKSFRVPEGKSFEPYIEGKGEQYLCWVTQELKCEIDAAYRTLKDAETTGICGYSTGGLNCVYAILKYGQVFRRAIVMSAAVYIWMDQLKEILEQSDYSHIRRLYLDTGTNEFGRMTTDREFLEGAEMLKDFFVTGCPSEQVVKYNVYQDAIHSQREWRMRFPDALRWIYPEY